MLQRSKLASVLLCLKMNKVKTHFTWRQYCKRGIPTEHGLLVRDEECRNTPSIGEGEWAWEDPTQYGGTPSPAQQLARVGNAISSCRQWLLSTAPAPADEGRWRQQPWPEHPAFLQHTPLGSQECEAGLRWSHRAPRALAGKTTALWQTWGGES